MKRTLARVLRPHFLGLLGLVMAGVTHGQALNDTGSSRCIDGAGSFLSSCAGTGEDGANGRDVTHADAQDGWGGFSYRRVCHSGQQAGEGTCPLEPASGPAPDQWGCTLDTVTGLMWEVKTNDGGLRDRHKVYTNRVSGAAGYGSAGDATGFANAVNAVGLCGHQDWRVPTRRQLESLMNYGIPHPGPVVDERFFPYTPNRAYWSSSVSGSGTILSPAAMGILMDWGGVSFIERSYVYPVRLVRMTQPPLSGARFTVSPDGQEVTDASTGLTWRRCVDGMSWNGSTCTGVDSGLSWLKALNRANRAGGGWRMPNVRELSSLVEDGIVAPSINTSMFPGTPEKWHWSSTPVASDPAYVWSVHFRDARISDHSQLNAGYQRVLRLVRGGL